MINPFMYLIEWQMAWLEACSASMRHAQQCWQHMGLLQSDFYQQMQRHQRNHIEIATGPSFLDKYGKRARDIDPERDV